eukprot:TRINITY_DN7086_c0_g1_i1.p1 TRINITY_DN7086_c0_g1~~TRINITY_DN7086_c0_g1_i1.p1  ORF type:complete len:516 (+),score=121.90 TRINITY_DN7086_c0_g1_i1:31-1578(+)
MASASLPPNWPLLSPQRTSIPLYEKYSSIVIPSGPIEEPAFTDEEKKLIEDLRQSALTIFNNREVKTSSDLKSPIVGVHWRDIYNAYKHKTNVVVTTRDHRETQPDPYQRMPQPATWKDYHLHQFLVARKNDIQKATEMFINYLDWYSSFGVDDLMEQEQCPFRDQVVQFAPERLHFTDKTGRPLICWNAGQIRMEVFFKLDLPLDVAFILQTYKRFVLLKVFQQASVLHGRRITNVVSLVDLAGFTMTHRHGVPWIKNTTFIDREYFPETLYRTIVINTPGFFTIIWKLVAGFLDERTKHKIALLGHHYQQEVSEVVGIEVAPRECGGQCTRCEGDGCMPLVATPDEAEVEAQRAQQVQAWEVEPGISSTETTVGARNVHKIKVPLLYTSSTPNGDDPSSPATPGDKDDNSNNNAPLDRKTMWWSFQVASKDIEFSLQFEGHGGANERDAPPPVTIVHPKKYHASDGVVRGSHTFTFSSTADEGQCVLVWNNHYSYYNSKHITEKHGLKSVESV